jgi:Mn2+/Fe2+ NRAMP family transporter
MQNWRKVLGPGILFASTAIGVSHLVQSTQAGAQFGLGLLWAVVLANVLKFPFFEYGSRYAAAKGETILKGYLDLNRVWLYAYMGVISISMFFVTGAVGVVTYGFMEHLFGLNQLTGVPHFTLFLLFIVSTGILWFGRFSTLNKLIKGLGFVLLITTLVAFLAAMWNGPASSASLFPAWTSEATAFILPLMGWMPTAVDISAWNSIWTVERIRESQYRPTMKETLQEFNFGYWISAVLAVFFLLMGAFLLHGTGEEIPKKPDEFSSFIVSMYTRSIGEWTYYIISAASFSIMFSTFITVLDGYSRTVSYSLSLLSPRELKPNHMYRQALVLISVGGLGLIVSFLGDPTGLKGIVNIATIISFLIAPIVAILNFRIVQKDRIGAEFAPGKLMTLLSYLGILYLTGFSVYYLYTVWST